MLQINLFVQMSGRNNRSNVGPMAVFSINMRTNGIDQKDTTDQ